METVEILKSFVQEKKNNVVDLVKRRLHHSLPTNQQQIEEEIEEKGYAIIPGFMTPDECGQITKWMDEIILSNAKVWKDEQGSDHRIFFANQASELVNNFFNHPFIIDILSAYERTGNYKGFTLANKVVFRENNAGSGGGWHRDFVKRKQTKALVYLSKVDDRTGPFQFITGTHRFNSIVKFQQEFHFKYNQSRFSNEEIDRVIQKYPERLFTVTGEPGTMILVDTRGIHRGKPIQQGTRYALTNYYWFNASIPAHIRKLNPFV